MVFKIMKTFASEVWHNPKEGWELVKMLGGALITFLIGAVCFGCEECCKIVVDKIRKE